jgi:hypothetical protein
MSFHRQLKSLSDADLLRKATAEIEALHSVLSEFANATSRPWAVNVWLDPLNASARIESKGAHGIDNDGWIIADLFGPDAQGNAELIVRAVNAFEPLTEALQGILDWAEFAQQHPEDFNAHGVKNLMGPAFDNAEAALAKARGEQ